MTFMGRRQRPPVAAFAVLLVLAACADEGGGRETPPAVSLRGRVLNESEALGKPQEVAVVGERVVVLDGVGNPAIHVVRAQDGTLERSFGRQGGGPGEFQGVRSLSPVPGSGTEFWVYDVELRRLTHLDLARGDDIAGPGARALTFSAGELPMSPVWVGGEIASPGIFPGGRLAFYDTTGRRRRVTGPVPSLAGREVPVQVLQHAYTGTMVANPGRTRLALGTRHADRLEIYRAGGEPVAVVRGPEPFEPAFEVRTLNGKQSMASGDDMRFGYVDVYATDDRIFALFSGRVRRDFPGRASFAEHVHEYDWDGRLLRVLKLDAEVLAIAADPAGKRLYAVRWTPTPAVLEYPL